MKNKAIKPSNCIAVILAAVMLPVIAGSISKIDVSENQIEKDKEFSLTLIFSNSPTPIACGLQIDWGDGKIERLRVGEGQQLAPPYKINHTYSAPNNYKVRISGEFLSRGLRSVPACDVNKEGVLSVVDSVAVKEKQIKDLAEAKLRKEREESAQIATSAQAAKDAEEHAKRLAEAQLNNQKPLLKASVKSCEKFLNVFRSRYKYAYDWPDNSCQDTYENNATFVITGRNAKRNHPYNVSQYWYQPQTETVLYTVPHKSPVILRVSDFLDASKPAPGPNDTPDGVGKQAWRERCMRHAVAKNECAVAVNPYQCMEIKLGSSVLNTGNMYCRGAQPDFRMMGVD